MADKRGSHTGGVVMQMTLKVEFVGGETFEVTTTPLDLVKAERHAGVALTDGIISLETMYFLGYSASRRAEKAGSDFEAWLGDVANIELVEAPEADDPKAQPTK